jgi:uncharacterized protein (DUF2141 family)
MLIRLTCCLALCLLFQQLNAQGKVNVSITNIKNNRGVCRTCLFNNEASFKNKSGKPVQCLSLPVKDKMTKGTFENIPNGNYAIMVFHDENSNNKLDVNFFGIPKEGYGASKNKLPFASAPTFADNLFTVTEKTQLNITIKLRNL